ncbi:hypothetical protein BDZ89DRAFT_1039605 [Hymenopellis radicata]|nr:hypothetical protein BDZ89DRAFT_1039605 [Hymenopellis radicata]
MIWTRKRAAASVEESTTMTNEAPHLVALARRPSDYLPQTSSPYSSVPAFFQSNTALDDCAFRDLERDKEVAVEGVRPRTPSQKRSQTLCCSRTAVSAASPVPLRLGRVVNFHPRLSLSWEHDDSSWPSTLAIRLARGPPTLQISRNDSKPSSLMCMKLGVAINLVMDGGRGDGDD